MPEIGQPRTRFPLTHRLREAAAGRTHSASRRRSARSRLFRTVDARSAEGTIEDNRSTLRVERLSSIAQPFQTALQNKRLSILTSLAHQQGARSFRTVDAREKPGVKVGEL